MTLEALPRSWDVVVVGAGVAGTVSAYRLASRGCRVLLVDRAPWPRDKVCGGCVNAAALRLLADAGLNDVGRDGPMYAGIRLASGRRRAEVPLPPGRALSRRRLDAQLADRAWAAGVRFLPDTAARLGTARSDARTVMLRCGRRQATVTARLVLGCDGLDSGLLAPFGPPAIDSGAPIGLGTTVGVHRMGADGYEAGHIHMSCGPHGYVGLVRVEEDRLQIGAALDPAWVKRCGGPGAAVAEALDAAALPPPDLRHATWQGTPRLRRRRRRLGAERVLVLGDAAGYVEPFTGEGMAWAMASALAVEPLALEAMDGWRNDLVSRWSTRHGALIRNRQRGCRALTALLRRPRLAAALLPLIDAAPGAAAPVAAWLNRDYPIRLGEDP